MNTPRRFQKRDMIIALLLLLLFGSCTALGITLFFRSRQPHPTVSVPIEQTDSAQPNPFLSMLVSFIPEKPSEETTTATTETTAPAVPKKKTAAPKKEAALLELHNRQEQDNIAFYTTNMFPGDSVTQYYCVRVSQKSSVMLCYHGNIRIGFEKLGEALNIRIRLPLEDRTLYDGPILGMPDAVDHELSTNKATTVDVVYEITAYLDTSAGNEYQSLSLVADFEWWVEELENLGPPKTGDTITVWFVLSLLSLAALLVALYLLHRKHPQQARVLMVLILLALCLSCLCVTTYAATQTGVFMMKNQFETGRIKINLNDGKPVADSRVNPMFARFEPGMTVVSDFFIENVEGESTGDAFYKLYFDNVEGELAEVLDVTITDERGDVIFYKSKASQFTNLGVGATMERLNIGDRHNLKIWFHFPEETGNAYQGAELYFDLCATAVQAKNNPNGAFD